MHIAKTPPLSGLHRAVGAPEGSSLYGPGLTMHKIVFLVVLSLIAAPLAGCKSTSVDVNGVPCSPCQTSCRKGPNPLLIVAGVVAAGAIVALACSGGGGGGDGNNTTFPGR